jgi:hypothetical protein
LKTRFCILGQLLCLILYVNGVADPGGTSSAVRFKMDHTFVVDETIFPAGTYIIRPIPGTTGLLTIEGAIDHSAYFLVEQVDSPTAATKTEVAFQKREQNVNGIKYGYSFYLSEIRIKNSRTYFLVVTGLPEEKRDKTEEPLAVTVPGTTE